MSPSTKTASIRRIAIIGFGEVGGIFGTDFAKLGIEVSVFDILLASRRHRPLKLAKARSCGVETSDDLSDCVHRAELVISAVTATSALKVAQNAARALEAGQIFLDINSVSPETKCKAAKHIERSKAHFVEAAVMAAVPGKRLQVPMLLGGPYATKAAERMRSLGMSAVPLSDRTGVASAVKMCRSVMIKGLEALAVECLFAARRYGAEDAVLESLHTTYPDMGWKDDLPDYLISRVAEHGLRRAAEMREVAKALGSVDVEPTMAHATADSQERLVREIAKRKSKPGGKPFSWRSLADALAPRRRSRA